MIHVSTNTYPTIVGDDVLIGHNVTLHGCRLHDFSFVGIGSIVLDDAVVEEIGMLAAGSMLLSGRRVGQGELWAGSPAKFKRHLTDQEIEKNRSMGEHYYQLALQHHRDAYGQAGQPYPALTMRKP